MEEMEQRDTLRGRRPRPKGPNFGIVVISAGVALIVIFIVALIVLVARGKRDIPLNHTHKERNALVRELPAGGSQMFAVSLDVASPVVFAGGAAHHG